MAQTDFGGKVIIAIRRLADEAKQEGQKFAYETTHEIDWSRDSSDTSTKDGKIYSYDEVAGDFTVEMVSSDNAMVKLAKDALLNNDELEFWRIFTAKPQEGAKNTYAMEYFRGRLNDFDESADSDDFVTISLEADVQVPKEGVGVFNVAANGNGYEFRDLSKVTVSNA